MIIEILSRVIVSPCASGQLMKIPLRHHGVGIHSQVEEVLDYPRRSVGYYYYVEARVKIGGKDFVDVRDEELWVI